MIRFRVKRGQFSYQDRAISDTSPATELKSQKNEVELNGFRYSHVKDAVAHCEFLHWLEGQMGTNKTVTEVSAADKFGWSRPHCMHSKSIFHSEEFRSKQAGYVSLSFPTISAVGANAAQPHYHTSKDNDVPLRHDAVYLCDSGGQYLYVQAVFKSTLAFPVTTAMVPLTSRAPLYGISTPRTFSCAAPIRLCLRDTLPWRDRSSPKAPLAYVWTQ